MGKGMPRGAGAGRERKEGDKMDKEAEINRSENVIDDLAILRTHLVELQPNREVAVAITKIDEAVMWLTRFISQNGGQNAK